MTFLVDLCTAIPTPTNTTCQQPRRILRFTYADYRTPLFEGMGYILKTLYLCNPGILTHCRFPGATFAENFYGLKRVPTSQAGKFTTPVNSQSHGPALSQKDISKSLLVAVGLPYLKCRADLFYHQISGGSSASIFGENERELQEAEELGDPEVHWRRKLAIRFIQLFRKVYPFINALYHGSNLAYNIAYLFGKTRYYTPWLHLLGLELKRMSMNDYVSGSKSSTYV